MAQNKISMVENGWQRSLIWAKNHYNSTLIGLLFALSWKACVYRIWKERNNRLHNKQCVNANQLANMIIKDIRFYYNSKKPHFPDNSSNRVTCTRWGFTLH